MSVRAEGSMRSPASNSFTFTPCSASILAVKSPAADPPIIATSLLMVVIGYLISYPLIDLWIG
jgi:prepilin signal peptidase PulO-like enzyme (type II secretory pathway)